jgi:hypothetical protein
MARADGINEKGTGGFAVQIANGLKNPTDQVFFCWVFLFAEKFFAIL